MFDPANGEFTEQKVADHEMEFTVELSTFNANETVESLLEPSTATHSSKLSPTFGIPTLE